MAATFACVLNKRDGNFMGLSRDELEAWHECLCWLREPGNNNILKLYGTQYERLVSACGILSTELQSRGVLPEGSTRAKVRWTKRCGHNIQKGTLGETLGDDLSGIVMVDGSCQPMNYQSVHTLCSVVAKQDYRLEIQVPCATGKRLRRSTGRTNLSSVLSKSFLVGGR